MNKTYTYVAELKHLLSLQHSLQTAYHEDRLAETTQQLRAEFFEAERNLSPEARRWWFNKSSDQLKAHLSRFIQTYVWRQSRVNKEWYGSRWIRSRQTYSKTEWAFKSPFVSFGLK